jgi:hypothetical protein
MYGALFRDVWGEVQSQREWSPCRRSDTVFDTVLKAHVTSVPPGLKAMTAPRTAGSVPGSLAMAARSIESLFLSCNRVETIVGPKLSTYVKDTSAPAGGTTLIPYDSEAVRKVQNEPSRPQ